ncbi:MULTISPECIES: hypothetical protein [unclassified Bacillus cereus group]|uniref:hypothetical protein n=1 Tax=Bacillus cereus group TaxID=86661 RepID=UPI001F56AD82
MKYEHAITLDKPLLSLEEIIKIFSGMKLLNQFESVILAFSVIQKIILQLNYSPLNVLTDFLKWEIPVNTDVSTSYLSRLCP